MTMDRNSLMSKSGFNTDDIKIGNNCWIGSNCVILKGVTIGDNCVIGAGVVLSENVESNSFTLARCGIYVK